MRVGGAAAGAMMAMGHHVEIQLLVCAKRESSSQAVQQRMACDIHMSVYSTNFMM